MSICRKVFQQILCLYPKPFQEEFAKEMLETFEECEHAQSPWSLLADTLLAALRQQIHYRSALAPKSASPYPEIHVSLRLPRVMTGAALGAILMTVLWTPAGRKPPQLPVSRTGIWCYGNVRSRDGVCVVTGRGTPWWAQSPSVWETSYLYSSMVAKRDAQQPK